MRQIKITKPAQKKEGIDSFNFENIESIQAYNNGQVYTKGFSFQTSAGVANEFPIQLGGKPRKLHGILLIWPNANVTDDDLISLNINSELIIDKVNWRAYSAAQQNNPFKQHQFFQIPRALSGSDAVLLTVTSANQHNIFPIFYLSNK